MSPFFRQTAQAMIAKHIDRFPLLKLDQVIDWQPIEQYLNRQRTRYLRDHRGRPAYPLLSMFKAVLLGQWHSLSDGQKNSRPKERQPNEKAPFYHSQPKGAHPCRAAKRAKPDRLRDAPNGHYGLQRPHHGVTAGRVSNRLHHGAGKEPIRPNRAARALFAGVGGQGMSILKLDYQGRAAYFGLRPLQKGPFLQQPEPKHRFSSISAPNYS